MPTESESKFLTVFPLKEIIQLTFNRGKMKAAYFISFFPSLKGIDWVAWETSEPGFQCNRQNLGFWLVGTKHFCGTDRILDSDWLAQNISTKMKCRLRCSYRALFNRQVSIDFRPPSISSIEPTSAVIIQFSYFLKLNYFDSPRYLGFEDQKFWHAEYLSVNVKFITTVGISF